MIHHLSFNAKEPDRVANALAELLGATVTAAPAEIYDAETRFVCCGDDRGTLIVVEPWGVTYAPASGAAVRHRRDDESPERNGFHALIRAAVDVEAIGKIADREGWPWGVADYQAFVVVNVWLEGRQLVELATDDMLPDYLALFGTNGVAIGALADQLPS